MPSEQEKIEFSKVLAERIGAVSDRVDKLSATMEEMRDNHLYHIELRLKEIETTLKISWKIIIFGASIPAFASAILSVFQLVK